MHKISQNPLLAKFLKGSLWSLFIQVGLDLLTFLTSVGIARTVGDANFGVYAAVSNWVFLAALVGLFGADDLLIKQIPILPASEQSYLMRWMYRTALVSSILVMLSGIFFAYMFVETNVWGAYVFGFLSLPFFVFLQIFQPALRGFGQVAKGQFAEKIIQPLSFVLFLFGSWFLYGQFSEQVALGLRGLSFVVACVWAWAMFKKAIILPKPTVPILPPAWLKTCAYFMLVTLLFALNGRLDLIFLDIFDIPNNELGYYNAAARLADIAGMPFMIAATVITPTFSNLWATQQIPQLQKLFTQATRLIFLLTLAAWLGFWLLGEWFLGWYAPTFVSAYPVLLILVANKLLHGFFGLMSALMLMSGQEKRTMQITIIGVLATAGLQVWLVPTSGIQGAAWANLGGLLVFELGLAWAVWKKIGIKTGIF
jgi:O-antigen/teichoic acid export membrane protein